MKRWLLLILFLFVLMFIATFILFPKEVTSSNVVKINCSINSINRFVLKSNRWEGWWPGTSTGDMNLKTNAFNYKGLKYIITGVQYNTIAVEVIADGLTVEGTILFVPLSLDSVQGEWVYSLRTNANPINRVHLYYETRKINNNIGDILRNMKAFLENPEKVYGMKIEQIKVKDTILLTTKFVSGAYPGTSVIYGKIDSLKKYIAANNAAETNFPMFHVWLDSGLYKTTIAIPLDHGIPENRLYTIKRMIPGNILVGQVKGGAFTANDAIRQMGIFMTDNRLTSPAIPFESLITDRMTEPDSTKWITKIYYPVF